MNTLTMQDLIAAVVGEWQVTMTVSADDGSTTVSTDVYAVKRSFAEGRYIREEVNGSFSGKPHVKTTILGFNVTRARFEYVTADNHDAVLLLYVSDPGADARGRFDLYAEYLMPANGGTPSPVTVRTSVSIESRDRHRLQNFYRPADGEERPFLSYDYRRVTPREDAMPDDCRPNADKDSP